MLYHLISDPCPFNFTYIAPTGCYGHSYEDWTHAEAKAVCESLDAHLLSLETSQESQLVTQWYKNGEATAIIVFSGMYKIQHTKAHTIHAEKYVFYSRISNHMPSKVWDDITHGIHSQTSKVQPLKFGKAFVISSHTLWRCVCILLRLGNYKFVHTRLVFFTFDGTEEKHCFKQS